MKAENTIAIRRYAGTWYEDRVRVARVTKTMIVIKWGHGELRFNRSTGRACGSGRMGLAAMSMPHIDKAELHRFEQLLTRDSS